MASTYHDLELEARRGLLAEGSESAEFDARELLMLASGKTREELVRDQDLYPPTEVEKKLRELVRRRGGGEPLAYVLGMWSFRKLDFLVNPSVLIPRQETEILADLTVKYLKDMGRNTRVLDLCAGSGCIGLSVAYEVKNSRVVLVELSDEALEVCRKNIRLHRLTGRVVPLKGDALLPPSPALGMFDALVCNPPYITTGEIAFLDESVTGYEPIMALDGGRDGLDFYRSVVDQWRHIIRPGGYLLFEVGDNEQSEKVGQLLTRAGFRNIRITRDLNKVHRVVSGRMPLAVLEPDDDEDD